jgi:hypothetical protein
MLFAANLDYPDYPERRCGMGDKYKSSRSPPSIILTLRLWQESLGNEQSEWRGEVKNLTTGEVRYFRQWEEIAVLVPRMIEER